MTTLTLHKLPEGFIVTSDEKPEIGELYIDDTNLVRRSVMGSGTYWDNRNSYRKVIAQQDQIDFSALTEEEQKEIGWFDVESILDEEYHNVDLCYLDFKIYEQGYRNAFQKAQELLYDTELFDTEIQVVGDDKTMPIRDFLFKPKSWTIEGQWENNKLKVTKIL